MRETSHNKDLYSDFAVTTTNIYHPMPHPEQYYETDNTFPMAMIILNTVIFFSVINDLRQGREK